MLKCIFIQKKFYDYLDNTLKEDQRIRVSRHLESCQACRGRLHQMSDLISLAGAGKNLCPPEEFWSDFKTGLDRKLNSRLYNSTEFRPAFNFRLKPALAFSFAAIFILTVSLYFQLVKKPALIARADEELIDEVNFLDDLQPGLLLNHSEDSFVNEIDLQEEFAT